VNTDRLGADDTVTLKFLKSPTDDMLFLNSRLSSECSMMEFQSRTSTSAFTNAEGSFIQDPNLHGFAKIEVQQMARNSYFSDWFKLMNTSSQVVGKILVKTQFVKEKRPIQKPKARTEKKVCFEEEDLELDHQESPSSDDDDFCDSLNDSYMSTYKGPLKKDVSGDDLVKDSNSLSLAGQLLRRHKVVT